MSRCKPIKSKNKDDAKGYKCPYDLNKDCIAEGCMAWAWTNEGMDIGYCALINIDSE